MSATPTHELCSIAHTQCVSSRAQSAFHRAGGFLCSVTGWTREGAYFRSVAFSCRTRSVFHRTGHFFRAVAGWTWEDMPTVLWRSLFRGFLIFRFEKILCSIYALDARAHEVCSFAHAKRVSSRREFSSFYTRAGRERTHLPFYGFLIFRSEKGSVLRRASSANKPTQNTSSFLYRRTKAAGLFEDQLLCKRIFVL